RPDAPSFDPRFTGNIAVVIGVHIVFAHRVSPVPHLRRCPSLMPRTTFRAVCRNALRTVCRSSIRAESALASALCGTRTTRGQPPAEGREGPSFTAWRLSVSRGSGQLKTQNPAFNRSRLPHRMPIEIGQPNSLVAIEPP